MKNVLVTEKLHPDGIALLESRDDINVIYAEGDLEKIHKELPTSHAVLVRTIFLTKEMLGTAPDLQVVSRHGVGCDNIDVGHLSSRNIPMAIAVNSNTVSVVEHVLMMMLSLNKRSMEYDAYTRNNDFAQRSRHYTSELNGKNVLVVGFGRIGKRIAPVLKAFGMNVTVADIALDAKRAKELECVGVEDFRPHLASADYLTVHVPLDDTTHHLIGKAELDALPSHAIAINCARGGIIDEIALAEAVRSGSIAAAGVDVFEVEPPAADNPLLGTPNTILTPHNAAGTEESLSRMASYAAQNILDTLDGKLSSEMIFNAAEIQQ